MPKLMWQRLVPFNTVHVKHKVELWLWKWRSYVLFLHGPSVFFSRSCVKFLPWKHPYVCYQYFTSASDCKERIPLVLPRKHEGISLASLACGVLENILFISTKFCIFWSRIILRKFVISWPKLAGVLTAYLWNHWRIPIWYMSKTENMTR